MTAPFVGLPTEGEGCSFALNIDSPRCSNPPTLHIQVRSEAWGSVALATCSEHASLARSSGSWVTEHPYGPDCPESTICWVDRMATSPNRGDRDA